MNREQLSSTVKRDVPPAPQFIKMPPSATHLDEWTWCLASVVPSFTRKNSKWAHHQIYLLKTVTSCIQGSWRWDFYFGCRQCQTDTCNMLSNWNWTERTGDSSLGKNLIPLWGAYKKKRDVYQHVHGMIGLRSSGSFRNRVPLMTRQEHVAVTVWEELTTVLYTVPFNKHLLFDLPTIPWGRCCPRSTGRETEAPRG